MTDAPTTIMSLIPSPEATIARNLGITHAVISKSEDPETPFELHIHGIRNLDARGENGSQVLIATVDDDKPMLATRILRMLQGRGIEIEGPALAIEFDEPDIAFIGMRGSMNEDGSEWTDLETRFVDGQKIAAARFPDEFEVFAREMADLFPRPAS